MSLVGKGRLWKQSRIIWSEVGSKLELFNMLVTQEVEEVRGQVQLDCSDSEMRVFSWYPGSDPSWYAVVWLASAACMCVLWANVSQIPPFCSGLGWGEENGNSSTHTHTDSSLTPSYQLVCTEGLSSPTSPSFNLVLYFYRRLFPSSLLYICTGMQWRKGASDTWFTLLSDQPFIDEEGAVRSWTAQYEGTLEWSTLRLQFDLP